MRFPEILFLKQVLPESKTFKGIYQKQAKVHSQCYKSIGELFKTHIKLLSIPGFPDSLSLHFLSDLSGFGLQSAELNSPVLGFLRSLLRETSDKEY